MLPLFYDRKLLEGLPLPDKEGITRVLGILGTLLHRRVIPFFRSKRGADPTLIARILDRIALHRLEDDENRISLISLVSREGQNWTIHIHERIFDYLAFIIPNDPDARLGGTSRVEGKILAFAEFALRHQMEHILYPFKTEREIIHTDIGFALERGKDDPTFYHTLRKVLQDEMNGIGGQPYLVLFNAAEEKKPIEYLITRILAPCANAIAGMPSRMLNAVFPALDRDLKAKVLGECYRRSRDTSHSLIRRTSNLRELLNLFSHLLSLDEGEARDIFNIFKEHWGLLPLFHELEAPETDLEDKESEDLFLLFKESLKSIQGEPEESHPSKPSTRIIPAVEPGLPQKPVKSLKDRIEEARSDSNFPRQVISVIDKNKVNAAGHSGSKYSELIETLLAIPWGKTRVIETAPKAFEDGLNRTHYGLWRPKEIVCDFFSNLIWRFQQTANNPDTSWHRTGSAFLFVGPPGVGKTSLAISIARNLGIAYHKISLGGMRDEADLRGHGFTYEGSKPGAIVQGLIKMEIMNGMFIMDEADKTEKFAIATLLEILDPEQNHLFHDRYTETTVDIDLSNCHFILTANTLETVPPAVLNRCEVVVLDRYSVEEKIAIAQGHLIRGLRERYGIKEENISFDAAQEKDILRYLIKTYTHEPGVRELERIIRTLFLRILRKEILSGERQTITITREKSKQYLETPVPPRQINEESRVGEMLGLGVDVEQGVGSVIPIQATRIRLGPSGEGRPESYLSMVHTTGNIQKIMDESRKVATTGILHCAEDLGISLSQAEQPIHLHFMGGSTPKDGPSAGGAIALALGSALNRRRIRRDVAMTGEIDTQGRITGIGHLDVKLETAYSAGCKTLIIPRENLQGEGGVERLPGTLKEELQILAYDEWKQPHHAFDYSRHALQVVAVDHIVQAADVAFIDEEEIQELEQVFVPHGRSIGKRLVEFSQKASEGCLYVCYCRVLEEIHREAQKPPTFEGCRVILLVNRDLRNEITEKMPGLAGETSFFDFNPSEQNLLPVMERFRDESLRAERPCHTITLSAPFFFLKREGIRPGDLLGLRLFANNYSIQGVKIKGCKPVLNRVYRFLAPLEQEMIEACPFLSKEEEIFVIDFSFIPEKYRLDERHAEQILAGCLDAWLKAVEEPAVARS